MHILYRKAHTTIHPSRLYNWLVSTRYGNGDKINISVTPPSPLLIFQISFPCLEPADSPSGGPPGRVRVTAVAATVKRTASEQALFAATRDGDYEQRCSIHVGPPESRTITWQTNQVMSRRGGSSQVAAAVSTRSLLSVRATRAPAVARIPSSPAVAAASSAVREKSSESQSSEMAVMMLPLRSRTRHLCRHAINVSPLKWPRGRCVTFPRR